MHARVNTTHWNPDRVDAGMRLTEERIIPAYREHPGFRGYMLLTEPGGGERAMAITLWDSEENMQSSAGIARAMVGELKDVLQAPPQTDNFEVRFYVTE
jgi:quinol monooxygenase YgiN